MSEGLLSPGDAFLGCSDNTTADAWMHITNFFDMESHAGHLAAAREYALTGIESRTADFGQWFSGLSNVVADACSRIPRAKMSDAELTDHILNLYPDQTPSHFRVSPLPDALTSEIFSLMSIALPETVSLAVRQVASPPSGDVGSPSSRSWAPVSQMTPSSTTDSPILTNNASFAPSPSRSVTAHTANLRKATLTYLRDHAVPMSTVWQRPLLRPSDETQDSTLPTKLASFYDVSSRATQITTPEPSIKSASHLT